MKKPRHLLLVLTSLVLACILVFAVACKGGCKSCKSCADAELETIELSLDDVKTDYYTGDTFTASGLKITANFTKGKPDSTITDQTEGVEIDSSAFRKSKVGTYAIKVSYTLNEKTAEATYDVTVSEVSLSIDASSAKLLYIVNEDNFTTDGLKVNRTVTSPAGDTTTQLGASDYTVDKGGFDKTQTGTYTITAKNVFEGRNLEASYTVRVIEPRQGLQVTFKDGKAENETITLQGTTDDVATADLSEFASWIEARKPDKYGKVPENAQPIDLTAESVTVKLYEGMEPIAVEEATELGSGAYIIWVELQGKDNDNEDFVYIGFVNVFVVDNVKSIELDDGCSTTQARSLENTMFDDWTFTVTYESGKTVTLNYGDSGLTVPNINANQSAEGENPAADYVGNVTATYNEFNAKRVKNTVTTDIEYTLTGNVISQVVSTISFTDMVVGKDNTSYNSAVNGTLTLTGSITASIAHTTSDKYSVKSESGTIPNTSYSYTKCFNTGGASRTTRRAIKIELEDGYVYTVTVYANGNGTGDARSVSIYQGTGTKDMTAANGATVGEKLPATDISACTFENISKSAGANLYIGGDNNINIYYIVITATSV